VQTHCVKPAVSPGNVTRYVASDELAASECYKRWFEPAKGVKRKGYNIVSESVGAGGLFNAQGKDNPAVALNPWAQAAYHALLDKDTQYDIYMNDNAAHSQDSYAAANGDVERFYGLGISTVAQALFVEYPNDPLLDYQNFEDRVYEAVCVLTPLCVVFFALLAAAYLDWIDWCLAVCPIMTVLIAATVYRAQRVPGMLPGDGGFHTIVEGASAGQTSTGWTP